MTDTCKYPGCDYDESSHRPYARKRDGIPSVTAISSALDVGDKARAFGWSASLIAATTAVHETPRWWNLPTHLEGGKPCTHRPWRISDGEERREEEGLCRACLMLRSEFDRQWKAKAALGGHIHHMALDWAMGKDVETDETTTPYLDALEKFYLDCQPTFLYLEQTVHHYGRNPDEEYRGQFDFMAGLTHGWDGLRLKPAVKTGLWDIKTGGFYPVEQTLQLAAYRYAEMTTWQDGKESKGIRMPEVDEAGVLMLHDDGNYELIALPATEEAFQMFVDLRRAWGWGKCIEKWDRERKAVA